MFMDCPLNGPPVKKQLIPAKVPTSEACYGECDTNGIGVFWNQ
jgi:hypothetical protein